MPLNSDKGALPSCTSTRLHTSALISGKKDYATHGKRQQKVEAEVEPEHRASGRKVVTVDDALLGKQQLATIKLKPPTTGI